MGSVRIRLQIVFIFLTSLFFKDEAKKETHLFVIQTQIESIRIQLGISYALDVITKGLSMLNLKSYSVLYILLLVASFSQAQSLEQPSIEVRCQVLMTPPLKTIHYRFIGRRDDQLKKTYSGKVKMLIENDSLILSVQNYQPDLKLYIDAKSKQEIPVDFNPTLVDIERLYQLPGSENRQSAFYIFDPQIFSNYKETIYFPALYQMQMDDQNQFLEANCSLKQFRTIMSPPPVIETQDFEDSFEQID